MERTLKIIALFIFLIILCLLPTLVVGSSCDNFTIVVKINIAANFTYQPQHPKPGDAVTFTDTSYPDIAINWTWDFGDGSISYQENPTHTYYYAGTYQVTLTVVNEGGINDTILKNITVSKVTHPSNNPPTADANGPYYRHVGQTITFDGSKSSDLDGTIVSYDWDFGDGNTGVGVTSTHIYSSAGTYTMILTVTDNEGATDSDPTTVTISVPVGFLFDV
ncbi:MAG: PKD domain-containing protein, partial [Thermoplasmatales archaeon]|nr:PKD domain-containing protein [Thermoplasmatales archaeon]